MQFLFRKPTLTELKRNGKAGHCLFCRRTLKAGFRWACESKLCQRDLDAAKKRDSRKDVFQVLTPLQKRKATTMALNDEQHKAMQDELDALKKTHAETVDAIKQQKAIDTEEARKAKAKGESPGKVELDPDLVKEVAEQKERIAKLEKRLGGDKAGGFKLDMNFFGGE